MPTVSKVEVLKVMRLQENIFRIDFQSEVIAKSAQAGQFLNIRCSDGIAPLLRRPISICDVDREHHVVSFVFQKKALGTQMLSKVEAGDRIDVLGPLGKGFDLSPQCENILVVGGGIGVFPLLFLLKESQAKQKAAVLGFRNRDFVVLEQEFYHALFPNPAMPSVRGALEAAKQFESRMGALQASKKKVTQESRDEWKNLQILTDDGSYGQKGLVTSDLLDTIRTRGIDMIYTCGPNPMLKQVVRIAQEAGVPCQVSVEQRMGCGIGACLVCACKVRVSDTETGPENQPFVSHPNPIEEGPLLSKTEETAKQPLQTKSQQASQNQAGEASHIPFRYQRVCKDGPVFWGHELIFEEA